MADLRQCEFYVVRYVPDVVKDEPVNIGVVLLEAEGGDEAFAEVRFTRDWRRARCADPDLDVELMESFEDELRRMVQTRGAEVINYKGPMSRREWLLDQVQNSFSGALQLTAAKAVLTESPQAELGILAHQYLETATRERRMQTGRRVIYAAMKEAFETAGVWNFMWKDIAVAQYTSSGDPLKVDCAYKPVDNVIHMFQAVSLATAVDSAKVLAFSYQDFREGMAHAEGANPNLYAVVEDGLDASDAQVGFALATFDRYGIDVARVSQMPAIAEQAGTELGLWK
jgi:hypothetical protein